MTSNFNINIGSANPFSSDSSSDQMKRLTSKLGHFREISDDLWKATATIGIAISSLDTLEEVLTETRDFASKCQQENSKKPLGISHLSRLSAVLKEADFQETNLLLGENDLQFLTESDMVDSSKVMSFQTIPSANMSFDNGPFVISREGDNHDVCITVEAGHNPVTALSMLDYIRIAMRRDGEERKIIAPNLKWTRTPKAICAVLNASIRAQYVDLTDVSVTLNGNRLRISCGEGAQIDAVSLQGARAGAFAPITKCLVADEPDYDAIDAAIQLALDAVSSARDDFRQHDGDVSQMEALVNSMMERVALLSFMPSTDTAEAATLNALAVAQGLKDSGLNISNSNSEALKLMLNTERDDAS